MKKSTFRYLQLFYFVRYLGDAFFYAFFVIYLNSINLSTFEITLITSAVPLLAFTGSVIFRSIAKNLNINRLLMVILALIEAFALVAYLIIGQTTIIFVFVLTVLTATINLSYFQLMDGYSGTTIKTENKTFSALRLLGSCAYVIAVPLGGFIVKWTSYEVIFALSSVLLIATSIMAFFLPKQTEPIEEEVAVTSKKRFNYSPRFIVFLFWSLFVVSLATVSDNFFGVYLQEVVGFNSDGFALVITGALVLETIMFFLLSKMKDPFKNAGIWMYVIGVFAAMRFPSIGFHVPGSINSNSFLIITSCMRGIGWGMLLVFNVVYLTRIIPLKHLTKALFTTAIVTTLGRSLGGFLLGAGVDKFGYNKTYLLFGTIVFISLIVVLISSVYLDSREKKERLRLVKETN